MNPGILAGFWFAGAFVALRGSFRTAESNGPCRITNASARTGS